MSAENNVNMSELEDCVLKNSNMTPWGRASVTRFMSKRRK
ncbi:Sulfate and thiosulfate import ATP-binding protein CysA [Bacillus velezensis]|nr:Sulfate and thiosulfate import ATP-binding protein CysA [Bacillus velezensis]